MAKVRVTGEAELLRKLQREVKNIRTDEIRALDDVTRFVKSEAVNLAPVEFGVLRNSAFNVVFMRMKKVIGRVGFTADYAGHVHEMPMKNQGAPRKGKSPEGNDRKGVYWGDGENKFLQKAITRNISTIRRIIKNRLKR